MYVLDLIYTAAKKWREKKRKEKKRKLPSPVFSMNREWSKNLGDNNGALDIRLMEVRGGRRKEGRKEGWMFQPTVCKIIKEGVDLRIMLNIELHLPNFSFHFHSNLLPLFWS